MMTIILAVTIPLAILLLALLAYYIRRTYRKQDNNSLSSSAFRSKIHHHKMGMSVCWDEYKCIHRYEPSMPDELELLEGDVVFKLLEYDDGWAKGYNTRSQEEGIYPIGFTEKVGRSK